MSWKTNRKTHKVFRSTGIMVPGVPMGVPLPGGGYEGLTKELDNAVVAESQMLKKFGTIEIRFNSDRQSGGAFVKAKDGDDVGLTAGIHGDGELHYAVVAHTRYLKDSMKADIIRENEEENGEMTSGFIHHKVTNAATGLVWLEEAIDWKKLQRPKPRELKLKVRGTGVTAEFEGLLEDRYITLRSPRAELPIAGSEHQWKSTPPDTIARNISEVLKIDTGNAMKVHAAVLKQLGKENDPPGSPRMAGPSVRESEAAFGRIRKGEKVW